MYLEHFAHHDRLPVLIAEALSSNCQPECDGRTDIHRDGNINSTGVQLDADGCCSVVARPSLKV